MSSTDTPATSGIAPIPALPPPPGSAAALLPLAMRHHQAGELREAERLYRQILAKEPLHVDSLHLLGVLHAQIGRFDDAIKLIRKAIGRNDKVATFHGHIAEAYRATGRLDKAVQHGRRAIALDPGSAEAHANLGNAFQLQGRFADATAQYRAALTIKPDYAEAHTSLGIALMHQGSLEAAVAECREALRLSPDLPEAQVNLGVVLKAGDDLKGAIAQFRSALARRNNHTSALVNLGSALVAAGELDEAIACSERALHMASGRAPPAEPAPTALQSIVDARNPQRALGRVEEQCFMTLVLGNCWRSPTAQWGQLVDAALEQEGLGAVARLELLTRKAIQEWITRDLAGLAKTLERGGRASGLIGPTNNNAVRHPRAYMGLVGKLLAYANAHPDAYANGKDRPALAVIGNSHCLPFNGAPIRLGDVTYQGQAQLVMGCKAWHLARDDSNLYQSLLRRILAEIAPGSPVLCMIGEFDCRLDEGILPHFKSSGGDLDAQIDELVGRYVRRVAEWAAPRQLKLHFVGVPAPHVAVLAGQYRDQIPGEDVALLVRIIQSFNRALERAAAAADHHYVDVYGPSAGPDGRASGKQHIDEYHLRPDALVPPI